MPTLLSFNNNKNTLVHAGNEKGNYNKVKELERQLEEEGSLQAAVELTSGESQHENDCYQCNKKANYFIIALQSINKSTTTLTNATTLQLVTQAIDLIQSHNKNTNFTWLTILMKELRDFGKRIRDESVLDDIYVALSSAASITQYQQQNDTEQEQYGRAIRISIYHCRATIMSSTKYYRKCLAVLPTPFDYQSLQQSARQYLTLNQRPILTSSKTSSTVSSSSSSSSSSNSSINSTMMICASCGTEKKRMPVCSKCKSQSYCGIRCLKSHKSIHDLDCHQ